MSISFNSRGLKPRMGASSRLSRSACLIWKGWATTEETRVLMASSRPWRSRIMPRTGRTGQIFLILPGGFFPQLRAPNDLEVKEAAADPEAQQSETEAHQADAEPHPFADGGAHGRLTTWEGCGASMPYWAASFSRREMAVRLDSSMRSLRFRSRNCFWVSWAWEIW